jgi:hypothetical protein
MQQPKQILRTAAAATAATADVEMALVIHKEIIK